MIAVIWSGATTASDVFLLIAVVVAAVYAVIVALREPVESLPSITLGLVALGLLAL